jgi:hypothetical protein
MENKEGLGDAIDYEIGVIKATDRTIKGKKIGAYVFTHEWVIKQLKDKHGS